MTNPSIRIYQNNYREFPVLAGLTPFDGQSWLDSQEREFGSIFRIFDSGLFREVDYCGLLSPKFQKKTGLSGVDFNKFVIQNPGADVYFINPYLHIVLSTYNIWEQGEIRHPGIVEVAQRAIDFVNYPIDLLRFSRTTEATTCYCNYWVGSQRFWTEFIGFCRPISSAMLADPGKFLIRTNYHEALSFYPFIMERLFSTFLVHRGHDILVRGIQIIDLNVPGISSDVCQQLNMLRPLINLVDSNPDLRDRPEYRDFFRSFDYSKMAEQISKKRDRST